MRIAIISDIHEDIVSLKQALRKIEKNQCDEIYCLGDISGFCVPHYHYYDTRDAHECLKVIRDNCSVIIIGNHDLQAAKKCPQYSPQFNFPTNWYSLDYKEREKLSNEKVWLYDKNELDPLYSRDDIDYLKTLPEKYILSNEGANVLFSHYLSPNLTGVMQKFYHHNNEIQPHFKFMEEYGCMLSFAGHSHPNGLFISTKSKTILKGYNRKYYLKESTNIIVPPITGKKIGNGFCLFDTTGEWVKAVRV